jgi:hypothetical protein
MSMYYMSKKIVARIGDNFRKYSVHIVNKNIGRTVQRKFFLSKQNRPIGLYVHTIKGEISNESQVH